MLSFMLAVDLAIIDSTSVFERLHGGIGCVGLLLLLMLGLELVDVDHFCCPG